MKQNKSMVTGSDNIEHFIDLRNQPNGNIFFDKERDDWEICTKSTVGGRNSFFRDGGITIDKTFRYMFLAATGASNLDFDDLCKDYCYSFVLQHPDNRIVTPFNQMSVYLIACYKINNEDYTVQTIERDEVKKYFEIEPQNFLINLKDDD